MAKNKLFCLIVFPLLTTFQSWGQSSFVRQLRNANHQITEAYLHNDAAALLRIYARRAVLMPEFHPPLFGKSAIAAYQRAWYDSVKVSSYSRSTHDMSQTGDYIVETGTFSNHFTFRNKAVAYEGKYLNVWEIKPGGSLQLLWEITGSISPAQRTNLPLSAMQVPYTAHLPTPMPGKISAEIQSLNDQISALVIKARGSEFAKYYTDDAIYAPYDMPMVIGKTAIDSYYREHEDPRNIISAVHIGATDIITAGDCILVNALYQVDWGDSTSAHGTVTGKNITIWKRMPDGRLLMFRQMAVHD